MAELAGRRQDRRREARGSRGAGFDPRITNSEGGSFDSNIGGRVFANSRGFAGSYRSTYCSVSAVPVATQNGAMERDYWFTIARDFSGLEAPELVGRTAAERVIRRLGAVKVETQRVPDHFRAARCPVVCSEICSMPWRAGRSTAQASFLAGKLGEKIASDKITLIDDGTIPGLFGSQPFDDEGVPIAAHPGDRKRRAEELPAEYLHGAQAGDEDHRQRVARHHGQRGHRARQFLSGSGRQDAGSRFCRSEKWFLCDRTDRQRCQYRNRRLFARRGGVLDSRRRTGVSGIGSNHREHAAGDVDGSGEIGNDLEFRGSVPRPPS